MNNYDKQDLLFLIQAMRIEAHNIKRTNPEYAKSLFDKLDRIQPQLQNQ